MKPDSNIQKFLVRPGYAIYIGAIILVAILLALVAFLLPHWLEPGWRGVSWALVLAGLFALLAWRQWRPGQNESRLENVLRTLIDGAIAFDDRARIIDIDENTAGIFGYTPAELHGKRIDLLMSDVIGDPDGRLEPDDASKIGPRLEVIGWRKDGSEFPVDLVIDVERTGRRPRFNALVCDISEHKQFDRELENRFQLLETVIAKRTALLDRAESIAHIGHWDWDIRSGKIYWSDELCRILGREPDSMVSSYEAYVNTIIHPDDRNKSAQDYALALRDPDSSYRGNHRILHPSGDVRFVYERAEVYRDNEGDLVRMTGIVQDITGQFRSGSKRDHAELSSVQVERIAEIGHFLYDEIEERYLYASSGCAKIYGMSEDEFINHYANEADDLADIHDLDRQRVKEIYDRYAETGKDCNIEFRINRTDGEVRWIRELLVAHQMKAGTVALSRGVLQDITDQKNIELELREAKQNLEAKVKDRTAALAKSEERFQLAMRGSNDGVWDWNFLTDEVYYSPRWFEILGYDAKDWPGTIETWRQLINPDDRQRVLDEVDAFLEGEMAEFKSEYSMKHRDGHWVPILSRATMQLDPDSDVLLRLVGTHVDLTEQHAAEAKLRASEAHFRSLVSNIPGVVYSCAPDKPGRMRYVSDYIETMTAYPASDFIGDGARDYDEIIHPADGPSVRAAKLKGIETSGNFEIEYRVVDRHGDLHWVLERGQIIHEPDGKALHLDGFILDISERVLAEQALKKVNMELDDRIRDRTAELDKSKKVALSLMHDARREKERAEMSYRQLRESTSEIQKLQQAVEQSPISIVICDTDGIIEYANAYASEISQYDNSELVGAHFSVFRGDTHADDVYQELEQHISDGTNWAGDLCNRKKDGSSYWESASVSLVFSSDGKVVNLVLVKLDITEQREMQDALIEAKEYAEAANRAKSSFLAMMSHEIRTPMNGVLGMLDLIVSTSLSEKQQKFIKTAQESALSLLQIINDILDFSKIEAGHMEVESIPVAWKSILEDVADLLAHSVEKKNLRLYCLADAGLPLWVRGDPGRQKQILTNLIGNAIKFTQTTPDHCGEIHVVVRIDEAFGPDQILLEVSDNGIGMSAEQVDELFRPFVQADSSTQRRFGGTGLGLSICARLAKLMGGEIGCSSELGVGSKFWVRLPCDPVEPPTDEVIEPDLSQLNILLLGNEPILRDFLESDLAQRGASVTRLADYDRAVEVAAEKQSDVVLLYADWPRETMVSLCASFRQDARLQNCGLVMTSHDMGFNLEAAFPGCLLPRSNPFVSSEIRRAIAVAAGRIELEIVEEVDDSEIPINLPTLNQAEANGTLILIVEDNQTNQEVIQQQLNLLGYVAETAGNGLEALECLASRRYAVMLTDCNMPEMDGYELASSVRESELEKDSRLPIIAITANALLGESERCLAAGMDDYISKPVRLDKLRKILRRWLPSQIVAREKSGEAETREIDQLRDGNRSNGGALTREASASSVIDHDLLAQFLGEDIKIQQLFLHKFVTQSESVIAAVNNAVTGEAWDEVGAQAHKLKSSSRAVGAVKLADLCAELERAGKRADVSMIKTLSPKLGEAYGQVREYVEAKH